MAEVLSEEWCAGVPENLPSGGIEEVQAAVCSLNDVSIIFFS